MSTHDHGHSHGRPHTQEGPQPFAGGAPCCCGGACQAAPRPEKEDGPPPASARSDVFRIEAMDCPTEEAMLRKALGGMPGVAGLRFNLLSRELTVHHDLPDTLGIVAAIAALGMEAVPVTAGGAPRPV
ncbi:MAG TPA: cation transporter, partial [Solidesulfovibrio sp.]|nr:heavy metal translocating P-type ATPase [Desulfovibrio sp.]HML62905.1 cation transporter [Solidesulfovibrio sp.]